MQLYSTKNPKRLFSLKEAVLKGLPDDNGLFMPTAIPTIEADFFNQIEQYSFQEIAFKLAKTMIGNYIPSKDLENIIKNAVNFPAPVVSLEEDLYVLELFHGPSLAFKDFGARFMAQLMSYFNEAKSTLKILVATSGDTGGAVAAGFYKTPGIEVIILYPSGKVSLLQEKQLTTLGHNITALEVDGTFDDCQALVKKAFLDKDLNQKHRLSSANSINIARLIPQSFYYAEAYKQVKNKEKPLVFSVPSGNFGNLTAGLFAKRMGLPVHQFIAATNANNVVPTYLATGKYSPQASTPTLSNAMDVGAPSNFARMLDLYGSTWNIIKEDIKGYSYSDEQTKQAMKEVFDQYKYTIDPHGAVAYLALKEYQQKNTCNGILLETAHPSKFIDTVEEVIQEATPVPARLEELRHKEKEAIAMSTTFSDFKEWLMGFDK